MNTRLDRLKKRCRIVRVILDITLVAMTAVYFVNLFCVMLAPQARIIGKFEQITNEHGTTTTWMGINRIFLEPNGPDNTLMLRVVKNSVPWVEPSPMANALYVVLITAFMLIAMKGVFHLRLLFGYFSQGEIFTAATVKELRRIGDTLLWWVGFCLLAIVLVAVIARTDGLPIASYVHLPIWPLVAGILLNLVASIFAEGQRLDEEARLTV